mgnify:CR=1 FL=1
MAEVRESSLTGLVSEIMGDVQRLVRDEVQLARVEITESIRELLVGATALAVAGLLAYLGLAFIGRAPADAAPWRRASGERAGPS